ncbi:MAG: thermosome subunit beta [Candidatus Thermoplasmatota archaeon]|nr:thermosome subunit beta [Candidatus Thermoplasmatota archaeon]
MAEAPVLEDTERTTGRVALRKNIAAAMALSGAVRSTLGPKGLDKLLLDDEGRTLVTNDGVTVLETARVEHPVARMLIDASSAQDRAARDGTTSAVVIAAELLRNAWHLVLQGVHPSTIVRGYRMAESEAMAHLVELAFEGSEKDLITAVRSSLAGKASHAVQDRLADLAMEAAMCVERTVDGVLEVDPTRVSTVMAVGRPATDSEIVEGLVLQKRRAHPDMVKLVENGTIALLDGGLERRKMRGDVTFQATTPDVLDALRRREIERLLDDVEAVAAAGVEVLAVSGAIDDEAHRRLLDLGIQAFRRVPGNDLDVLALATGATVLHHVDALHADACGRVLESRSHMLGDLHHWTVRGEGHAATLIARGSGDEIVEETSRCFDDALGVAAHLRKDRRLLVGGGASHVHLARHLRRFAEATPGREQMAIEAFADALEVIPRALAENAGLDPIDALLDVTAAQADAANGAERIGLHLEQHVPTDLGAAGVLEPLSVIQPTVSGATEAACAVLRIDDVLWARLEAQIPDDIQAQLDAMGEQDA